MPTTSASTHPPPPQGDQVTVTVTVLNDGTAAASDVQVRFIDISSGESLPIGDEQTIDAIPAGGSGTAQIVYDTAGLSGDRQIQAVVDPNNYIAESDETDNIAKQKLTIGQVSAPNLVMQAVNIGFQPPLPITGETVTINAVVLNDGATDASNVLIQFNDITSGEAVPIVKEQTIAVVPAGGSASAQAVYDTTGLSKDRKVQVLVDSNNLIAEVSDSDNDATKVLSIAQPPMPNLVVRADSIGFSPPKPRTGDPVRVSAVVLNTGAAAATDVVVQLLDVTGGGSIPIGEHQVIGEIAVGESGMVQVDYDTTGNIGDRKIQVVADPNNFIPESNETDNKGAATLLVLPPPAPNLTVESANIGFSPPVPSQGVPVVVSVTILNGGTLDADDVLVQFVDVTDGGMVPIGEKQTIERISAGGDASTQVTYETAGKVGVRKIRVLVDPHTIIPESNEGDNNATRNLTVTSSPAPNLVVQEGNIGFNPVNPVEGDTVSIQVTVQNNGDAPATEVAVQFVDVTGGGSRPIGANQTIALIDVGSSGSAQVSYDTTGRSGDRKIQVVVDPNNLIPESNEGDNVAKQSLDVASQPAPNLVINANNISFAPPTANPGDQVTINAIVINAGTRDATDVVVQFADVTSSGSAPIGQQQTIDAIPAGGSGSVQVTYDTTGKDGDRKIQVVVDPNNFIPESGETDNEAQKTLEMATLPAPNLNMQSTNIGFRPADPTQGQQVVINATVLNDGSADAGDVVVLFLDTTDETPIPIGTQQVIDAVPVGGSGVAQVTYDTTGRAGERKIEVQVDPNNFIQELKETDNEANGSLTVTPSPSANLAILPINIGFNPPKPIEGDLTTVNVVVLNTGAIAATDVVVQFADVSNGGSAPLGTPQVIASIATGSSSSVQVTYDTSGKIGTRTIQVVADPNNFVVESDKSDNLATRTLTVAPPPAPNLMVLPGNIKFEPSAPNEGDLVNVLVTVLNNGTPMPATWSSNLPR
ncbi:MAG: hypothetical protein HC802_03505 [Caldilineaceae bacterium]|nr:hypothetical protein [Caldilineaceae bacterium]